MVMVAVMKLKLTFLSLFVFLFITACSSGSIMKSGHNHQILEIKTGNAVGVIAVDSFKQIIETRPHMLHIVDVRTHESYSKGSFTGAVNIPMDELVHRMDEITSDKPVVFICNGGIWAGEAYDIIKMFRPDVKSYYLNASVNFGADGNYTFLGS